jgi:hypothetical protein
VANKLSCEDYCRGRHFSSHEECHTRCTTESNKCSYGY